jgi:segregation and condensation protein B
LEEERLKAILESLLFAAAEPVGLSQLITVLETVARDDIKKALAEMATTYAAGGRGIALEEVAGGYQLRTPKEHATYVRKLLASKPPRLSRPLLETVAIIAYRQPITRPEIEQLRGVDCGGVLDTLVERRLIKIAGRKEAPGRPIMYTTTTEFLELFGLKDLDGLPDLEELRLIETPREEPIFVNEDAIDSVEVEAAGGSQGVEELAGLKMDGVDGSDSSESSNLELAQPAHSAAAADAVESGPDADSTSDETGAANTAAIEAAHPAEPAVEDDPSEAPADTEDHD